MNIRTLIAVGGAIAALATSSLAHAGSREKDSKLVAGPPVSSIKSPYAAALSCLATQLTPEQKETTVGILYFIDRTGKEAYAPESSSGKFLSQGTEDMLMGSLFRAGINAVEWNPLYRNTVDWTVNKLSRSNIPMEVALPDIVISGSFNGLDFIPGHALEAGIWGFEAGTRENRILATLDGRVSRMPGTLDESGKPLRAGKMLAGASLKKQVVSFETKGGVTNFFGTKNSSTFIELNASKGGREPLQYTQRTMIDAFVFDVFSQAFNITTCGPQREYADTLVSMTYDETLAP